MNNNVAEDAPFLVLPWDGKLTSAGFTFFQRHAAVFNFFHSNVALATKVDENRARAAKALATLGDEHRVAYDEVTKNKSPAFDYLASFSEYQSEIICIRMVDNFNCYLSDLIQECFSRQPALLRSQEAVRLDEIMEFSRFVDFTKFVVDRKLRELSYGGLESIQSYFWKNLGLSLTENDAQFDQLKVAIELRNVYTHSRGRIDRTFVRRVGNRIQFKVTEGRRFHAEYDTIVPLANNIVEAARSLDDRVASKFGLSRRLRKTWERKQPTPRRNVGHWLDDLLTEPGEGSGGGAELG